MTFVTRVIEFYENFAVPPGLPSDLSLTNPYQDDNRRAAINSYYSKYFDDDKFRHHILGINPSRMNATATGIHYTDGFALQNYCDIGNSFSKSRELTSDFFYRVVIAVGGPEKFFGRVFPWAMMPVTVTKKGNYANYYANDVVEDLSKLVENNVHWTSKLPSTGRLVILGSGENKKFFQKLSGAPFGYNEVRVLPHPRWIMQYNHSKLNIYVDEYIDALT